jgi:hypothetical protein
MANVGSTLVASAGGQESLTVLGLTTIFWLRRSAVGEKDLRVIRSTAGRRGRCNRRELDRLLTTFGRSGRSAEAGYGLEAFSVGEHSPAELWKRRFLATFPDHYMEFWPREECAGLNIAGVNGRL